MPQVAVMGAGRGGDNAEKRQGHRAQPRAQAETQDGSLPWFERRIRQPVVAFYHSVIHGAVSRQSGSQSGRDGRHVTLRILHNKPLVDARTGHAYAGNGIRSSRYTVWDFIPKQIVFQATRLHNAYFIALAIPQAIPGISTTGTYTNILPVLFFILLTMLKEAYDDFRRHRMDRIENRSEATVLRSVQHNQHTTRSFAKMIKKLTECIGLPQRRSSSVRLIENIQGRNDFAWMTVRWQEVQVGDILRIRRDEALPADILLLHADGESSIAYVETMALDGETNLKSKHAPHVLQQCRTVDGICSCQAVVVAEDPNRNLYDWKGRLVVDGSTYPLDLKNVLLRGSVLRNTPYAFGLVIYTGEETKSRMNANHHPRAKKPRLERYANQIVLTLIFYIIVLSVGVSMGYLIWHRTYEVIAWYLNNAYVAFGNLFMGYIVMFNNNVPLALYVSLEIVKLGQMVFLNSDVAMYDEATNTPMVCNTNTILENLGQVSYVLTDKTGTLTENEMTFRAMSVGGVMIRHHGAPLGKDPTKIPPKSLEGSNEAQDAVAGAEQTVAKTGGVQVANRELQRPRMQHRCSSDRSPSQADAALDSTKLLQWVGSHPNTRMSQIARSLLLAMALCHTAIPETGECGPCADFQASSPDELALLRAARDLGRLLIQRSMQQMTLVIRKANGESLSQVYEILDVLEFSSKRKRMSVIVRCPDGRIWLLCKGADSVIIPRLKDNALASRKSQEVRRSAHVEREQHRRSEQAAPRNSFGGRPSMTLRRKSSLEIQGEQRSTYGKQSLDVPKLVHGVQFHSKPAEIDDRKPVTAGLSLDVSQEDDGEIFGRCFQHLHDFATQGLRTLMFAERTISAAEYSVWKKLYQDASTSLTEREERTERAAETIEQGLDLLGATAIEDKLQRGVPETIDKLRRANMKIWMLTGDKRETAINIAHSAGLCTPESELHVLDHTEACHTLLGRINDISISVRARVLHSVLVVDGYTLSALDNDTAAKDGFYALMPYLDSVICCRAAPAQKAEIVKSLRLRIPSALTLAIGDGANDVAMIQSSHVGVGISGKEGLQAARVADYSIAQFRFLQRLLLVHGRWSYIRTAKFILWTFYKEMFFYMMQALYQRYNGYTGSSLYENWSLTVLNTLFTSLCVIVPGIFEQDLQASTLLSIPELYVYGQRNKGLNLPDYFLWMAMAVAQGMIVWFIVCAAWGRGPSMSDNGTFALGDLCFSLGIQWTNLKLLVLETHYKTAIVLFSFFVTSSGWWAWNGFMSAVYSSNLSPFDVKGGFGDTFGKDPKWWLVLILVLTILTLLDVSYKALRQYLRIAGYWPLLKRRLRWRARQDRNAEELDVSLWQALEKDGRFRERIAVDS